VWWAYTIAAGGVEGTIGGENIGKKRGWGKPIQEGELCRGRAPSPADVYEVGGMRG